MLKSIKRTSGLCALILFFISIQLNGQIHEDQKSQSPTSEHRHEHHISGFDDHYYQSAVKKTKNVAQFGFANRAEIKKCGYKGCSGMYTFEKDPALEEKYKNNKEISKAAGCKRVKVYFIKPSDVAYDAERIKYCDIAMREIQQQWASQGKTMYVEPMVYVEGGQTVNHMLNNGGYFTYAIDNELVPRYGLANGNYKVMLFVDGIGGNGAGGGDYAGAPVWAIDGYVAHYRDNDANSAGMPGLIGHELGHAFGVYHEDGSPDNGSVACENQCIPKGIMCNGGGPEPCGNDFRGYPQVRINDWNNGYFNQYPDYFNQNGGSCNGPEFIWDTDYPNVEFNKEYIIRSKGSQKVLSMSNGNLVQQEYVGSEYQRWIITPEKYGLNTPNYIRYSQIINAATGEAIDNYAFNTDIGGNIVLWGNNGQTNQQWRLINRNGDYVIQNMASGWVMDVQGNSYDENANIHQWEWNEGNNQLWQFDNPCDEAQADSDNDGICDIRDRCPNFNDALIGSPCDDNDPLTERDIWQTDCSCVGQKIIPVCTGANFIYRLINVNSGKALEVGGFSNDNGGNVQQWEYANVQSQHWYFQKLDDAALTQYTLTNVNSGKVLEIGGNNKSNGGNAQQWDYANANSQKWRIEEVALGQFVLTNVSSRKVLDVNGNSSDNGANVHQWDYTNGDNQKWQFELVAGNCIPPQDTDGDGILDAEDSCPDLDNGLIGTACDDNNPSTTNDTWQSDCSCAGTIACNVGASCDDNDPCTINDVYTANCDCAGAVVDSDNDGVCDTQDQCPGFNDNIDSDGDGIPDGCDNCSNSNIGTACDDGNPCTVGETYDAGCNCVGGTLLDSDNDGICNAEDQCPNFNDNLIGTNCNDGDPCTVGEIYYANCGCSGGVIVDSDNDGVCDTEDNCPNLNNNLIGTSCNDGDPCTTGETYDSNCGCSGGVIADADNDGVCDTADNCMDLNNNLIGTSCSDGDPCTTGETYDSNCGCSGGTIVDADNDGVCDSQDICPGFNDNIDSDGDGIPDGCDSCGSNVIGTACNDGDPCTVGETYDAACNCSGGVTVDVDNDGVCDRLDQCPGFNDNLIGTSCDDGDLCTVGEVYDNTCNCTGGQFIDQDSDGICEANDIDDNNPCVPVAALSSCGSSNCTEVYDANSFETGLGIWNDGGSDAYRLFNARYAKTGNYSLRIRDNNGSRSSFYTDAMNWSNVSQAEVRFSYHPNSMENGENFNLELSLNGGISYQLVKSWISGSDFTNNNSYDELVSIDNINNSSNVVLRFMCDATSNGDQVYIDDVEIMICTDDGGPSCIIGTPCDDGNDCTIGETYDNSCLCADGRYVDADNDGYCIGDDPNDDDPCIPVSSSGCQSGGCQELMANDFEINLGMWNDGGSDAYRLYNPQYSKSGDYSLRIRDNSGTSSSFYTRSLDLSSYSTVQMAFSYYPNSMESGESFYLEASINGGISYSIIKEWTSGVEFNNRSRYDETVTISNGLLSSNVVLRLRCDASSNADQVYLDDIVLEGCGGSNLVAPQVRSRSNVNKMTLSPNPVSRLLKVGGFPSDEEIRYEIYSISGMRVCAGALENGTIDVSTLVSGVYLLKAVTDTDTSSEIFIKSDY